MTNSTVAKIFGWFQFAVTAAAQLLAQPVHGWAQWLAVAASGAIAVASHAASNTGGPTTEGK